ncbi:hypothetical protein QCA50_006143 [Cerrena zonata]|uniref:Uncharacterized protein n=1 Tax=Cerrena zonata TaxID=2478898 RepID=A0AAW0GIJ7_9APHY
MSALAVATLKSANAQRNKSYRRRSRSMENLRRQSLLLPATPLTPGTVSAYSTESIEGALSPLSSRYTSTPRLQQGPLRTPTIQMTPDGHSLAREPLRYVITVTHCIWGL